VIEPKPSTSTVKRPSTKQTTAPAIESEPQPSTVTVKPTSRSRSAARIVRPRSPSAIQIAVRKPTCYIPGTLTSQSQNIEAAKTEQVGDAVSSVSLAPVNVAPMEFSCGDAGFNIEVLVCLFRLHNLIYFNLVHFCEITTDK
jgi:hypothetical protein